MSDHWREFRKHVLETKGRKCEDCGVTDGVVFDVHHLTYENLGDEQLKDVIVLCHSCHMARHPEKRPNKCKHENRAKASWESGGQVKFSWVCADCVPFVFLGWREPDEKDLLYAEKVAKKYEKWLEKEAIKEAEKEKKRKEKRERYEIWAKEYCKPKKKKKRKPYKKRTKAVKPE